MYLHSKPVYYNRKELLYNYIQQFLIHGNQFFNLSFQ
jgi:hypothetical protein